MKLRKIASPLTIASFIAVAITGLCMFFGYRNGTMNLVHEISSLVFVFGSILHIWVNWKPVVAHVKRPLGTILIIICLIATLLAVSPSGQGGNGRGKSFRRSVSIMMDADLSTIATLTKHSEQELQNVLKQNGCTLSGTNETVRQIASNSSKDPMDVLGVLIN